MTRRRLPIGIQTFRKIREEGWYYVDKTADIRRLVDDGTHYFLSRPRGFGKSLFLDTLKELFEGNEALFEGLAIHDGWDWSVRYPVVRLSFGSGTFRGEGDLAADVADQLQAMEGDAGVTAGPVGGAGASAPPDPDVARARRAARGGAGRRVRQADSGRTRRARPGLNNLIDITQDPRYSTICGYTDADLRAAAGRRRSG